MVWNADSWWKEVVAAQRPKQMKDGYPMSFASKCSGYSVAPAKNVVEERVGAWASHEATCDGAEVVAMAAAAARSTKNVPVAAFVGANGAPTLNVS